MVEELFSSQQVALTLFQTLVIAFSVYLGVVKYVIEKVQKVGDNLERIMLSLIVAIYLSLGHISSELMGFLRQNVSSGFPPVFLTFQTFIVLIGFGALGLFLTESDRYKYDLTNVLIALVLGTVFYGIIYLGVSIEVRVL